MERVRREGECWIFTGSITPDGYGVVYLGSEYGRRARAYAHRISYEIHVAQIPTHERFEIHHKCGNPSCVNPDHLECLSRSQHARLNEGPSRDTCVHGHPRTPENVYITPTGSKNCRVCGRESARALRRAKGLKGGAGVHWRNKTHCPQGHPYDEGNTYRSAEGYRSCRTCRREADKRRRLRSS